MFGKRIAVFVTFIRTISVNEEPNAEGEGTGMWFTAFGNAKKCQSCPTLYFDVNDFSPINIPTCRIEEMEKEVIIRFEIDSKRLRNEACRSFYSLGPFLEEIFRWTGAKSLSKEARGSYSIALR